MSSEKPQQIELIGGGVATPVPKSRRLFNDRLAKMHRMYGKREGERCRHCIYFFHPARRGRTFPKCKKWGNSRGPGTDWRANAEACGLFETKP